MASSKRTETRPLHALAQLIPPGTEGRDFDFVLLTSLKPDAWFTGAGGTGAWHAADVESLAKSDMSPTRVAVFAQRVAHTIVDREISITHEDDFRDMKLVLGTRSKKPLRIPLSALDSQAASRFAFECFARVAQDAQTYGCHIIRTHPGHIPDAHPDPEPQHTSPLKRKRTLLQSSESLARLLAPAPTQSTPDPDASGACGTSATRQGTRQDAAAAVALAAEREPPGLGGTVDRLFSSRSAAPAVQRRPGASLANPNKAARKVTAVEFASDDEDV
ncbi:hypothetical protein H4582DRAFT_1930083 [Lactarius indigo]|nr:hypothetical protein H4582DRAFT_1930083 [Lactarius indigo]